MNPDHTPLEAAQAELDRFDRIADAVAEAPVHMARTQLREPLQDLRDIVSALDHENGRLADLLLNATDRHDVTTTHPEEVF